MKSHHNPFLFLIPAITCLASTHTALATNFWFDNNGTDPGFGTVSGETYNWTSETPAWRSSGTGSGAGLVSWRVFGSSNDAILTGSYGPDSDTLTLTGANLGGSGASTSCGGATLYTGYTPRPSDATSPWPAWCRTGY